MIQPQRDRFDALLDGVIEKLPDQALEVIERVPVILDDFASPEILRDLGIDPTDPNARIEICGLHTGVMDTEVDSESLPIVPSQIHLFREAIVEAAGGWGSIPALVREIRITLLHEIGHQLGLDEEDLTELGYD